MKALYEIGGITKQALFKHRQASCRQHTIAKQVIEMLQRERKDHKRMGSRKIYSIYKTQLPIGRDIFEQIAFGNGFKLR